MLKMCLLYSLLITAAFTLVGCGPESDSSIEQSTPLEAPATISRVPFFNYNSLCVLLTGFAAVRFDESERFSHNILAEVEEVYMPFNVPENFPLISIGVGVNMPNDSIIFRYSMQNSDFPFSSISNATFRRYHNRLNNSSSETYFYSYSEETEFNSIPWLRYHWSQHGYEFMAHIPARLPAEDAYDLINAFLNPQPVLAWEIQGNAISVSVQGMENVTIFDEGGREIAGNLITERNPSINTFPYTIHNIEPYSLYRGSGESLDQVGYSWLVSASPSRRQYVLEPGIYTFHVDGITRRSELLVRHFYNSEVVSSVDFSDKLTDRNISSITLTVTSDASGSGDTVTLNP